jgi:lysozyme family protein
MSTTSLLAECQRLWPIAQIVPARKTEVYAVAKRLIEPAAKARYQAISGTTAVPWQVIAVIHEREADQDFDCQLGQGDPLDEVSRHIPRGRGPFFNHPSDPPGQDAFYRAAVDALQNCPPYAARWTNWTAPGACTLLIDYNGDGYERYHNEVSPYIWGATTVEEEGKYVSDGHWSAGVWDTQIGCAAMLKAMMDLDPSIKFAEAAA